MFPYRYTDPIFYGWNVKHNHVKVCVCVGGGVAVWTPWKNLIMSFPPLKDRPCWLCCVFFCIFHRNGICIYVLLNVFNQKSLRRLDDYKNWSIKHLQTYSISLNTINFVKSTCILLYYWSYKSKSFLFWRTKKPFYEMALTPWYAHCNRTI